MKNAINIGQLLSALISNEKGLHISIYDQMESRQKSFKQFNGKSNDKPCVHEYC